MPIKKVTQSDLEIIASIHKQCFLNHYLGKFSKTLILKFYSEFLNKEGIIFIKHCSDAKIDGFILGGESHAINIAQTSFIKNNKLRILLSIITTPANWNDTFNRVKLHIRLKKFGIKTRGEINMNKDIRLLSIAVLSSSRRKGVALQLTNEFESILQNNGYKRYGLSVHKNNYGAIKFYERIGLVITRKTENSVYYSKSLFNVEQ